MLRERERERWGKYEAGPGREGEMKRTRWE